VNKAIRIQLRSVLLLSIMAFLFAGCGTKPLTNTSTSLSPNVTNTPSPRAATVVPVKFTSTPLQSPTATPPYIHYIPLKGFNIHLEFDYPSSWTFSERRHVISLGDPRFLTLPTPVPPDFHPTPHDYGGIDIWITPIQPNQTVNNGIEILRQAYSNEPHIKLLQNYKTEVDGYDAGVLEYQIQLPETHTSMMFDRRIFFIIEDQMYEILFEIAEKDRGGEFEKGYEYFFKSLKIVP